MATIFSKVSTQVASQQPDFIQDDHPDFLQFLKAYYEFMESAELKLNALAAQDSILYEEGSTTAAFQGYDAGVFDEFENALGGVCHKNRRHDTSSAHPHLPGR